MSLVKHGNEQLGKSNCQPPTSLVVGQETQQLRSQTSNLKPQTSNFKLQRPQTIPRSPFQNRKTLLLYLLRLLIPGRHVLPDPTVVKTYHLQVHHAGE